MNGSVFSDRLRDEAAKHYGHAGPQFVKLLIQNLPGLSPSLPAQLTRILEKFPAGLNAQETRVARSFAIIALAGELAIEWEILPWQKESVQSAVIEIFKHWHDHQPKSEKSKEHAQILKLISDFINAHGDSRFSNIKPKTYTGEAGILIRADEQAKVNNRAGYWEEFANNRRDYLFTPGGLKEAANGFDLNRTLRAR